MKCNESYCKSYSPFTSQMLKMLKVKVEELYENNHVWQLMNHVGGGGGLQIRIKKFQIQIQINCRKST